jgi:hypothetical protein
MIGQFVSEILNGSFRRDDRNVLDFLVVEGELWSHGFVALISRRSIDYSKEMWFNRL